MQRSKHICQQLKALRHRIAEENDIPLSQPECTHQGPCRGTCPRCEAEMRYLEQSLAQRIRMGRVATVAGLGLTLAACGGQPHNPQLTLSTTDTPTLLDSTPDTVAPPPPPQPEEFEFPELQGIVIPFIPSDEPSDSTASPLTPPPPPPSDSYLPEVEGMIDDDDSAVYTVVERDPEFPGGTEELYKWIKQNLRLPDEVRGGSDCWGKVYITFIVEPDGTLSDIRILRDIGAGWGLEVLRMMQQMPSWHPGQVNGQPVRTRVNLAVPCTLG